MKPLYLNGSEPTQVHLDGPALRVCIPGSAVLRFPLRRVSRVIANGKTSWSIDALLACADQGISVSFLAPDGTTRARWIGRLNDRDGFLQRWQDFQDRPDWTDLFRQWSGAARRRAIRMCAWRMGWSPKTDSRSITRFLVQSLDGNRSAAGLRQANRILRSLAEPKVLEALAQRGFSAPDQSLACLVPVLVVVVTWSLHPQLTQWLHDNGKRIEQSGKQPASSLPALVELFERNIATIDFCLRDALNRLQRFLMDCQ
ncbi:MAG: CRISPR-associated endonuclease Cas1 [Gammaproteobacteria bacterium]|nr:CRISPR-associated endonuclease Cas1 [Gammaproteobacteria bacterium]